ncbi:MAG: tRNA-modifying protein YgfZ [Alphaproteobacteria bacterium MarineAlpha5_Bin8]|nr:MAG: tRNA-modifying protein YgfZ [Alphaproteobacteria bacterium MarineAlpha5_Bin7]PPR45655.1 MAG: tRNA-modifying protein YgfZ [Alphaproteobacteria bacterium MarineAlpha5_Bin8]PPR53957.1 MAG: tRNA-modifying protein YgfZ [Alphaproteobacteria bacterium MarineAlpha5_Bin6]|tara:strand:- start:2433 stop:3278 length:846 start_codon:yes stop_codon:yes gene_type:complete
MKKCNFIKLKESKFIVISGDDCKDFLQSIVTNDINKCDDNKSIYSCLLTPQGKFIADFFVTFYNDGYLIEINEKFFNDFINKLKIYKLRSKIEIKENKSFLSIVVLENNLLEESSDKIIYFKDPRKENIGIKYYIKESILNDVITKFNLNEINFKIYRQKLMRNLIPYSVEDLIVNKSLLLENNFQNINAIDWNKGCYIGQEITARMKYRSLLKKQIYALKKISGSVKIGEILLDNNTNVGKVISFSDQYLLAMLKIESAEIKKGNKTSFKTSNNGVVNFL